MPSVARRATSSFLVAAAVLAAASHAPAQPKDNAAAVEALFSEGKRLVAEGKLGEACPKFLASYNLEQRVGTLLNLADCYERNGQTASAWARFVEARALAQRAAQPERVEYATQHASALEPKLARLTVLAPSGVTGLEVKRDGVLVEAAAYGVAVPIDPGPHTVVATAPGRRTWTSEVTIGRDPEKKVVQVPALTDVNAPVVTSPPPPVAVKPAAVAPPAPAAPAPPPDAEPSAPAAEERHGPSTRAVAGLVIAGVGVVGLGVGAGFGISALGKKSDADAYCGQAGTGANDCYGDGVSLRSDAVSAANVSTIFLAAGAALVAGGFVLWLTAPSRSAPASAMQRRGLVF